MYLDFWAINYNVAQFGGGASATNQCYISLSEDATDYDLRNLTNAPLNLAAISLINTGVSDLSLLRGFRLEYLTLEGSQVEDLTPLKEQRSLGVISLDPEAIKTGLEVLRSLPALYSINGVPKDEFWRRWDAGERSVGVENIKHFQPDKDGLFGFGPRGFPHRDQHPEADR